MPTVALLPVTRNPDQLVTYIEENFRRISNAFALTVPIVAGVQPGPIFSNGIEIYHSGSTPYIDFHRAVDAAGDSGADYNVRLINNVNNQLRLLGGGFYVQDAYWIEAEGYIRAKNARIGEDPYYGSSYASFRHTSMLGIGTYALMHDSSGGTFINAATGQSITFRINNNQVAYINLNGIYNGGWFRSTADGQGWYNESRGIGISADAGLAGAGTHRVRVYPGNLNQQFETETAYVQGYLTYYGAPLVISGASGAGRRPAIGFYSKGYQANHLYLGANDGEGFMRWYHDSGAFEVLYVDVVDQSFADSKIDIEDLGDILPKVKKLKPTRHKRKNHPKNATPEEMPKVEDTAAYQGHVANAVSALFGGVVLDDVPPIPEVNVPTPMVGLTAEELAVDFPEMVHFHNGEPHGVRYRMLGVVAIKAIQELDARLDELEKLPVIAMNRPKK